MVLRSRIQRLGHRSDTFNEFVILLMGQHKYDATFSNSCPTREDREGVHSLGLGLGSRVQRISKGAVELGGCGDKGWEKVCGGGVNKSAPYSQPKALTLSSAMGSGLGLGLGLGFELG